MTGRPARVVRTLVPLLATAGLVAYLATSTLPFDLRVYLAGGRAALHGDSLYGVAVQGYGFTYPPFAALVLAPLSLLPVRLAVAVFTAASLAATAVVVEAIRPGTLREVPRRTAIAVGTAAVVLSEPVRVTVLLGQVNLLLAALVAADLMRRPGARGRGLGVGLAAAIKLTPALFVLIPLLQRDRAAVARSAAAFTGVTLLTAALRPGDSRHFWFGGLADRSHLGDVTRSGNQSLDATAIRWLGDRAATPVWLVASVGVLVALVVVLRRLLAQDELVLALGITGFAACLVSPVAWTHHWVWWVPVALGLYRRRPGRRGLVALGVLVLLFCIGTNKPPLTAVSGSVLGRATLGEGYVIAALAVLVVLLADALRAGGARRRIAG